MGFEWDEGKRRTTLAARGIDFVDVPRMFRGRVEEREDTRRDYGERRFIAVGELDGDIISVVYTWRGPTRRLISARRATRRERKDYQAGPI
jgi:uncharacterized DUF497 family protein